MKTAQLLDQAIAEHRRGKLDDAIRIYEYIIQSNPEHLDAIHLLGCALLAQGRLEPAIQRLKQAIRLSPRFSAAISNLGLAYRRNNNLVSAIDCFRQAIELSPNSLDAHNNLASALLAVGQISLAREAAERAVRLNTNAFQPRVNLGEAKRRIDDNVGAVAEFSIALEINPSCFEARFNLARTLLAMDCPADALSALAPMAPPDQHRSDVLDIRGQCLAAMGSFDEAFHIFGAALASSPSYLPAIINKATLLGRLNRFRELVQFLDNAIGAGLHSAELFARRGTANYRLGNLERAIEDLVLALKLDPSLSDASASLGTAFGRLGKHQEALEQFERAMAGKPEIPTIFGEWLHRKLHLCDWTGVDPDFHGAIARIAANPRIAAPFHLLGIPAPLELIQRCARSYVQNHYPDLGKRSSDGYSKFASRLRIGYMSPDFRNHPVGHLICGLFSRHDREKFEIHAIAIGSSSGDDWTERIRHSVEFFVEAHHWNDAEIAAEIQRRHIDILIDLTGLAGDLRTGVFALRPAPIAVSYLGYAATMGAPYIDYLIADDFVIAQEDEKYFDESVVRLPNSFFPFDTSKEIAEQGPTRLQQQLPEDAFVFCCFNNSFKITADVFSVWMKLLKAVDGSVLWLKSQSPASMSNLRRTAELAGVSGERLVFATHIDLPSHFARHRLADLFLDTFHYNAHTTASGALWCGLPVLTLQGRTFSSRVAASLLSVVGLPELIASTTEQYVKIAMELANAPAMLADLRARLQNAKQHSALFDMVRYTRNFELALSMMASAHGTGQAPRGFSVVDLEANPVG